MSIFPTIKYIGLLCFSLAAFSAHAQQAAPKVELVDVPCSGKTSARIAVFFSGLTQLNDKPIQLQDLASALKDHKKYALVCYHREHPESESTPPQTEQVLNIIIQERLPVAFYWDNLFKKRVSFKE